MAFLVFFALVLCIASPSLALPAKTGTDLLASKGNDITCEFCTFAINELAKMLISNSTEQDVIKALDFLCNELPPADAQTCKDFVQEFGVAIVEFIYKELNATDICQFFGLCPAFLAPTSLSLPLLPSASLPSSPNTPSLPFLSRSLSLPLTPRRDPISVGTTCDICIALIGELDTALNSSTVASELEGLLQPLCADLGPFSSICVDFVNQYTPELLSYLSSEIDPTDVCDFIHACPSDASIAARVFPANSPCGLGSSFWCSSALSAARCNAIQFCAAKKIQA